MNTKMSKDITPTIKVFNHGDNWYLFNIQFQKLVTQHSLSIYFNPQQIHIAIPELNPFLEDKQRKVANNEMTQPQDITNPDGSITRIEAFPIYITVQESETIAKYNQKLQIYFTKCAQALTLLEIHLCPTLWENLTCQFPDLETYNRNVYLIHGVMAYLQTKFGAGTAINNSNSRKAMDNIKSFTTPEIAFKGMQTFCNLLKERKTWGPDYQMLDSDCKLWILKKSTSSLFNQVHFAINQNPTMTYEDAKDIMNNYIKSLLDHKEICEEDSTTSSYKDKDISNTNLSIQQSTINDNQSDTINYSNQTRGNSCFWCHSTSHKIYDCEAHKRHVMQQEQNSNNNNTSNNN